MLKRDQVQRQEDELRQALAQLPAERRAQAYRTLQKRLKDPDTYAALNWFFIGGLHHFYLRRWGRGLVDCGMVVLGFVLLFSPLFAVGLLCWLGIAVWELANLFRAQIIVQDWNNQTTAAVLREASPVSYPRL